MARLTRRRFLEATGGALAAAPLAAAARREPALRGGRFASGVMSGLPGMRAISLWTRVHGIERGGRLTLEIARDPGFARVVHRQQVKALAARDFTVHQRVASKRLRPGEHYWYRFETRGAQSPAGRFQTLRPPDSREPVRIGVFSCQGWQAGYFTAHAGLAAEDLDIVLSIGDYIYELTDDKGPREDKIGPNGEGLAETLREYRQKYRLYQSDPNLQAMQAQHPLGVTWDSHEVESGWGADHPGDFPEERRRVPYQQRRRNGIRAFFEAMPVERFAREPNRVYRRIPMGANAEVILTDLCQYSDPFPCPFQIPPPPCPEAEEPGRTLLGPRQKKWLKHALESSPARWKVLVSSVMMMSLDFTPGTPFNTGQWDGFVQERRELMEHLLAKEIAGVTVASGDVHTHFAGQVTTTGRSDGTPAATEFIGSSISSQGIPDTFGGNDNRDAVALFTERLGVTNPHITYNEQKHRGYAVFECRPDELRVDFRAPRTALEPESEVFTLQSFRVARDDPRVELV